MRSVCCQIEVPASGRSLIQRSPTQFGVSECDHEHSIMRRPWPTRDCCAMGKKIHLDVGQRSLPHITVQSCDTLAEPCIGDLRVSER